jgi:hypothetical protein
MKKLIASVLFFSALSANAYILVEPRLGLEMGNFNYSQVTNTDDGFGVAVPGTQVNYTGKTSGTSLGVKLGYVFDVGLYLGLENQTLLSGKLKFGNDSSGTAVEDMTLKKPLSSLLIGYYFPQWAQVTYGYIFSNDISISNSTTSEFRFKGGTGHLLNVGIALFPYVNLNVEYMTQTHKQHSNEITGGNLGLNTTEIGTFYGDVTSNSLNVYFSFPLAIEI